MRNQVALMLTVGLTYAVPEVSCRRLCVRHQDDCLSTYWLPEPCVDSAASFAQNQKPFYNNKQKQ